MKTISKIYHISDIHIRNLKRHLEYEDVFNRLFEYIKETKDEHSIIFLGGDIVHSKTDISPELIDVTSRFLKGCADLLPTILIAGNHDFNLKSTRLDVLSPIVSSLNHPNLHYWKDSGVYQLGGINFSVFSLFGEVEDWVLSDIISSGIKIALHHGPVKSYLNPDVDYGLELKYFDGFDIGLLGDLHQHHFVDQSKTIGYPGSLLCQNYAEPVNGHGILVWDVVNQSAEFVEIENDFGYITFDAENLTIPPKLPKNLRVRIKQGSASQETIHTFLKELGRTHKILEVVQQGDVIVSMNPGSEIDDLLGDNRNLQVQNRLISDHLTSINPNLSGEELLKVHEFNALINSKLPSTQSKRDVVWKPLILQFENMFSYGKSNQIDFQNFNSTIGIFAENAAGKSAIFDILSFALYDKSPRASKGIHILNNNEESFNCKFDFLLNGEIYTIKRVGTKQRGGNVKVDVEFYKTDESGAVTNLNGEDRNKTNVLIRDHIGNYDDFVMTTLSTQYDNQNFIDKSQNERKELLYKFLDINVYDDLFKIAKDGSRDQLVILKEFEREDIQAKMSELNLEIGGWELEILQLDASISEKKSELERVNVSMNELHQKLQNAEFDLDIDVIEREISNENVNIQRCITELNNVKSQIESAEIRLRDVNSKLSSSLLEFGALNCGEASLNCAELKAQISQLQSEIKSEQSDLSNCKLQESKLSMHKYDPNCKFCIDNQFVKDATKNINRIPEVEQRLVVLNEELLELNGGLGGLQEQVELATNQQSLSLQIDKLTGELFMLNSKLDAIKYRGKSHRNLLVDWETKKVQYNENIATIAKNNEITAEIQFTKLQIKQLTDLMSIEEKRSRELYGVLESKKSQVGILESKLVKYLKCKGDNRICELYLSAVNKDGVPYRIIEKILPVIQDSVNSILVGIVPFSITIYAEDDKYIQADIVYNGNKRWPIELASGMERFILSIAFRVVLSGITNLPKTNFLAIDEGFGVLDSDKLQGMSTLLDYLKGQYEFIICISHIESMRDMVDKHIKIEKNGYSKINV